MELQPQALSMSSSDWAHLWKEKLGCVWLRACRVFLVGRSSVVPVPDSGSATTSYSPASLSVAIYSLIPRMWLPLEPDLNLYEDLILLIQEVFSPNPGTLLATEYHV